MLPSPSEGGHAEFAPRNPLDMELLEYLFTIFDHVSYEHILSGEGPLQDLSIPERHKEQWSRAASGSPKEWLRKTLPR